ncbi:MAG: ABC-F family ATP-binding cassette domain-containing protein [Sphaerochaetaceae bacterium]|nr:ABC-F family ATP-binding cassette domain-containing protein [Spirochaetales bacterium]MDY5967767.1 ABC-F family ATP-binding cassette domain-containing protein [Sphaerochaetaceae bacterium]
MQLSAQNISLSFGDRDIIKDVSFTINDKSRIALVGANGMGKTTLLKIISSKEHPETGVIQKDKEARVLYASQGGESFYGTTLKDEAFKAFDGQKIQEHEKERLFAITSAGLGFNKNDYTKECSQFSQGYQMRIALLKVLLARPSFMLLDEPTNYLDIDTRLWLVRHLMSISGGYIIVSHDRFFLDKTVNEVFEIENGRLTKYSGNYSKYESERIKADELLIKKSKEQEKQIKKTEDFIERFRYKATKSRQVQSRIKSLEKTERIELPRHLKHIHFTIPYCGSSPNDVLDVKNVSKSYSDKRVLNNVSFLLNKKDRLAIVGENGAGKSTLLRIITSFENDYEGEVKMFGSVKWEYFRGDETLYTTVQSNRYSDLTVFEYAKLLGRGDEEQVKNMLGAFMFSGDDINKKTAVLSGGEKSRLELLTTIMHPSNLLILDEPTNHLDIATKDVLCQAISEYEGSVVFVSHDVDFISKTATSVLHLTHGNAELINGNWEYFSERMDKADADASSLVFGQMNDIYRNDKGNKEQQECEQNEGKLRYEEAKKSRNREKARIKRIEELENLITSLTVDAANEEAKLLQEEIYTSYEKSKEVQNTITSIKAKLQELENEWLILNE